MDGRTEERRQTKGEQGEEGKWAEKDRRKADQERTNRTVNKGVAGPLCTDSSWEQETRQPEHRIDRIKLTDRQAA